MKTSETPLNLPLHLERVRKLKSKMFDEFIKGADTLIPRNPHSHSHTKQADKTICCMFLNNAHRTWKHCKCMASLSKYMGNTVRGVTLILRCELKNLSIKVCYFSHSACPYVPTAPRSRSSGNLFFFFLAT